MPILSKMATENIISSYKTPIDSPFPSEKIFSIQWPSIRELLPSEIYKIFLVKIVFRKIGFSNHKAVIVLYSIP